MTFFGFGNNGAAGFRMADGFTIPAGQTWAITAIQFYNYQTYSTTTSTMTGVTVRIWNGPPNVGTSTIIFGDTTTNRLSASTWTNSYRVAENAQTDTTRPIMQNTATISTTLRAGTYWVDWGTTGSLASGPWAVPITIIGQTTTGDALQFNGTTWAAALDGTFPQGMPFIIEGVPVGNTPTATATSDPTDTAMTSNALDKSAGTSLPIPAWIASASLAIRSPLWLPGRRSLITVTALGRAKKRGVTSRDGILSRYLRLCHLPS